MSHWNILRNLYSAILNKTIKAIAFRKVINKNIVILNKGTGKDSQNTNLRSMERYNPKNASVTKNSNRRNKLKSAWQNQKLNWSIS